MWRCRLLMVLTLLLLDIGVSMSPNSSHLQRRSSFDEDIDDDIYRTDKSGCPVAFEGRCKCHMALYQNQQKYVVNCTNAGFRDADCLSALPDNTEVLLFTGNFVDSLPPNVFGTESEFDSLETIDMSNNEIREIDGQAFHRVSNVKTLILNHNKLYIVERSHHPRVFSNFISLENLHLTNAFTEEVDANWYLLSLEIIFQSSLLTQLKKLHLEQNEIWNFRDTRTFCDLPALQHLYLGNNRLAVIEVDLLCLKHLRYLDLEYNSLQRLDANQTRMLDRLSAHNADFAVKLTGNPFVCDCRIEHFYEWLRSTQTVVMGHSEYLCYDGTPPENAGRRVMQLKHTECLTAVVPESHGSGWSVFLGLLVVVLLAAIVMLVYKQRRQLLSRARSVQPHLQTAIQNVKRGRQYTNIEREEEQADEVQV